MTQNIDQMPTRKQFPTPAAYEAAMVIWRSSNPIKEGKIIPPADGTITVLKPRQPSGHYTHIPPKP